MLKKKKYLIGSGVALIMILSIGYFILQSTYEEKSVAQTVKAEDSIKKREKPVLKDGEHKDSQKNEAVVKIPSDEKGSVPLQAKEKGSKREQEQEIKIIKDLEKAQKTREGKVIGVTGEVIKKTNYYNATKGKEGTLTKGETIEILVAQSNWYIVNYQKGKYYVPKDSVKPVVGKESNYITIKMRDDVKVLAKPDKNSKEILDNVKKGKVLKSVGAQGIFYKVVVGDQYGYIERFHALPQKINY